MSIFDDPDQLKAQNEFLADQLWAKAREHQNEIQQVAMFGVVTDTDFRVAKMVCGLVLAELFQRSAEIGEIE